MTVTAAAWSVVAASAATDICTAAPVTICSEDNTRYLDI